MSTVLLIVGLLLFSGLIAIHEFGHFIAARRNGVDVEEFSIFFGPAIYKRKTKSGWLFSVRTIPVGGYVKLKGEHDSDTEKGSLGAASLWVKTKVMSAGVIMNLLTALVMFTILAWIGLPQLTSNQFTVKSDTKVVNSGALITGLVPDSPATRAGLKDGDEITGIGLNGHTITKVTNSNQLMNMTKKYAGQAVTIAYERDNSPATTHAQLLTNQAVTASLKTKNPQAHLGVAPEDYTVQRSTWSAPVVAVGLSVQLTVLEAQGLAHIVGGAGSAIAGLVTHDKTARENGQTNATANLRGPVGIFQLLKTSSLISYQLTFMLIAYISLVLAFMNILPIPVLDGGKLWITLISRAIKRPLSAHREDVVNVTGLIVLLSLLILITVLDVKRG